MAVFFIDEWFRLMENNEAVVFENLLNAEALDILKNVNKSYYFFQFLYFSLSVLGALLMWNLRKIGFHTYTVAQILLLINVKIFLPFLPFPWFSAVSFSDFCTFIFQKPAIDAVILMDDPDSFIS